MHSSNFPPKWPEELRQAHWRKALGLSWRWKTPATCIGPVMERAYSSFNNIDWKAVAATDKAETQKRLDKTLTYLTLTYLLARQAVDKYKAKHPDSFPENAFFTAADAVAKAAEKLANEFREIVSGRYTPRSRPGRHSVGSAAAGGSSSHAGHASKQLTAERGKELWIKYKHCSEWPKLLTMEYCRQRLHTGSRKLGTVFDTNDHFNVFFRSTEAAFHRINWKEYKILLESGNLQGLKKFYRDYITELSDLLDQLQKAAVDWAGLFEGEAGIEGRTIVLFDEMQEEIKKRKALYYRLPGSMLSSAWMDEL